MSRKRVSIKNDVRELRKAANLSQAPLGTAIGVCRQTINPIETGRYDHSLPLAFVLSLSNVILIRIVVLGASVAAALRSWLECGILMVIVAVAIVQARSPAGIE